MTILEALLAGIILYLLFHFGARWIVSIMSERITAKLMTPEPLLQAKLDPESQFIIQVTDTEIVCHRPDGICEKVAWDDLQKVEILTTSDGPFPPDVLWLLHGKDKGCVTFPKELRVDSELLEHLQRLPGFVNTSFMQAMGSTSGRIFYLLGKDAGMRIRINEDIQSVLASFPHAAMAPGNQLLEFSAKLNVTAPPNTGSKQESLDG